MKIIVSLLVISLTVIDACSRTSREELTIERSINGTDKFKLQGVYYRTFLKEGQVFGEEGAAFTHYLFFYSNGVIRGLSHMEGEIEDIIDYFTKHTDRVNRGANLVYVWGIYNVKNDSLLIERWIGSSGGPYPAKIKRAYIVNDTTLKFDDDFIGTLKFYPMTEKPDSTNNYIK